DSIDADTVFAAASMSKWIAAHAMMTLVENGRVDLDAPVSGYLTRWQLPASPFNNDAVTVRRLLSHTAGLNDNLGFGDYALDERLPSLEEELDRPRGSSGESVSIAVTTEPGSEWNYSGGSYLLLELLIEELTGDRYSRYVNEAIFKPLGMARANFDPLGKTDNHAGIYLLDGSQIASHQYASSAATGLVVSSDDLTKFVLSQVKQTAAASPLRASTLAAMRVPHGRTSGVDIWGLGTILYAPTKEGDFIFGHDGANDPAINTAARINPDTGAAIIVLASGHPSVATNIGSQWVLWQTGYPDVLATDAVLASMVTPAILGCIVILMCFVIIGFRQRQR
ncbi:MAG: serine hydrolase domain-containing protein, partial [Pseudomonadales bacterium]